MVQLRDGSFRYAMTDRPWHAFEADSEDLMKVIHVDEKLGQVVFVQRFGRNATHAKHTHHCTAVAYTLSGCWEYDGEKFPTGSVAFEPAGSTHTAMTRNDNVADVLVVLTSADKGRLLELHMEDGSSAELDIEIFKMMMTTSPEEFLVAVGGLRK
ncbi:MAG: cupin domain-containing protein [Parvibaculum sp.]